MDFVLPSWVDAAAWNGYIEMRKTLKKPLKTERQFNLAVNTLERLLQKGQDPTKILDQSTFNSWIGLFPLKENNYVAATGRGRSFQQQERELHDTAADEARRELGICRRGTGSVRENDTSNDKRQGNTKNLVIEAISYSEMETY